MIQTLTSLFSGAGPGCQHLLITWIVVMLSVVITCFIISELTFNYSQVDKIWSLMPAVYAFITLSSFQSPRLWLMAVLVVVWGARLSFNFARKGGYSIIPWKGEEDYRWKVLRDNPALKGRFRFGLFNLFFISFYQNLLIMLFSSPLLVAAFNTGKNLNIGDFLSAGFMLLFIITETVSDNQLYRFQQVKKGKIAGKDIYSLSLERGFICEGMWKYVRHPNFASEQLIWISFYFFSLASTGRILNFSASGAFLLVLLFIGSSEFTEKISSSKYPAYNEYRKSVPRFLPRIF